MVSMQIWGASGSLGWPGRRGGGRTVIWRDAAPATPEILMLPHPRGHSVGCHISNAKGEHFGNRERPAKVVGCFGTGGSCGTYSVDGKSARRAALASASTERTVWGHASQQRHRSHSFWLGVVYLTTDAMPSGSAGTTPSPAATQAALAQRRHGAKAADRQDVRTGGAG